MSGHGLNLGYWPMADGWPMATSFWPMAYLKLTLCRDKKSPPPARNTYMTAELPEEVHAKGRFIYFWMCLPNCDCYGQAERPELPMTGFPAAWKTLPEQVRGQACVGSFLSYCDRNTKSPWAWTSNTVMLFS